MKQIVIAFFTSILLTSCLGKNEFKVSLEADSSAYDGCLVSLISGVESSMDNILVRVPLKRGACTLKGVVDSADWYLLVVSRPDNSWTLSQLVYLDGNVRIKIKDDNIQVSGSKVNKVYAKFVEDYDKLSAKVVSLNNQLMTDPSNTSLQQALSQAYLTFESSYRKLAIESVEKNSENAAGIQILKSAASVLEDGDIESLLKKGGDYFLSDPFVQELSKQLELSKRVAIGKSFVDMTLLTPQGDSAKLSEYAGKGHYVLIDFWASWCGPCMKELPNLKAAYEKYHEKGFDVVGISLDEDPKQWQEAIEKHKLSWPQLSDLYGWKSIAVTLYGISSIPRTVLLDPQGVIIQKDLRGEELLKALASIFE